MGCTLTVENSALESLSGKNFGPMTNEDTAEEDISVPESDTWDTNFPAEADLAILLDTLSVPLIDFNTLDNAGDRFLPKAWLKRLREAYASTLVRDAIDKENQDSDWRLASIRISPCEPIGIRTDQDIDEWCWPAVHLIWQPVIEILPADAEDSLYYADDRAIKAIFPVAPRDREGNRITGEWRQHIKQHLAENNSPRTLPEQMRTGFLAVRDASATAVLSGLSKLRDPNISTAAYESLDLRPESLQDGPIRSRFKDRLIDFLSEFAQWQDLYELNAFSLPEGRDPATDAWVFVSLKGNDGFPSVQDITIIGGQSGLELVNMGTSQTITARAEDDAVELALEEGNRELKASLIIDSEDIEEKGDAMADPYLFLTPNTSCASCHKVNPDEHDFHALSGFEDDGISVSPRTTKEVERDIFWARHILNP